MLRYTLLVSLLLGILNLVYSQSTPIDTTDLTLKSLGVPTAPAFSMLGIEPSSIEKPKDVKDFVVSIANASQTLTVLPNSFAMEIAPAKILSQKNIDFSTYLSNDNIVNNIFQTFTISIGTNTIDSVSNISPITTKLGIAAKFSILRGKIKGETRENLNDIDSLLGVLNATSYKNVNDFLNSNSAYNAVKTQLQNGEGDLNARLNFLGDSLTNAFNANEANNLEYNSLRTKAENLVIERVGFKLDAAFGIVYDFPFQEVDSMSLGRVGGWLTGGWNIKGKGKNPPTWSILGSARVLNNINQVFLAEDGTQTTIDDLNFDLGGKVEFAKGNKLAISLEGLYRFTSEDDNKGHNYKVAFNGNYQLTSDYQVSLTFGRNFNGTISKGGNLLAAIHLFGAFGNRKINTSIPKT
ncbi:MAG: hypothetical protein AB8H03_06520 [Saprospiraceae bacterium]